MLFTTAPLSIIDRPADRLHKGGTRHGFRIVVIHATAGSLESSLNWLTTTSPPNKPVSVQRLIAKDGRNFKLMSDEEIAWHAGFATVGPLPRKNDQGVVIESMNEWSLGIELENDNSGHDPYPAAQLDMTAAQLAEWWGRFGLLAIVGHSWIDRNKTDPAGFPWDDFYGRLWARLKAAARS